MTTKFSRNRAKVQPTPKVCISKKPVAVLPIVDPYPAVLATVMTWSLNTSLPFAFSQRSGSGFNMAKISPGKYSATLTDTMGRACVVEVDITIGSIATATLAIPGFGTSPYDGTGTAPAWSGSGPYSHGFIWTIPPGISGTIALTISF